MRRIFAGGLVGRERRRATLTARLTLPAVVVVALAVPGCRTDSASARLSSLNPTQWVQRRSQADPANLQPVPTEQVTAPPLPLSSGEADPFVPDAGPAAPAAPAAPRPEPVDAEGEDAFYGVQPTGAELEAPREPSWTNRFRSLFRREAPAETAKPQVRNAAAASPNGGEQPAAPPQRITRRATVRLSDPEFDPNPEPALEPSTEPTAVRTVAQSEPARLPKVRGPERLPVIVPGRPASPAQAEVGPQAWPYAIPDQPQVTTPPDLLAPEPSPPALLRTIDESAGPALLR